MQLIPVGNVSHEGITPEWDMVIGISMDEWRAIRFASLMLVDLTMNAPLITGPGQPTRSDKMKGRRNAARLRDEVMRISNELGLGEL